MDIKVVLEIVSYLQIPITIYCFKKFGNRDVKGDILAGAIIGCMIEFISEPLWDYHMLITVYKDIPLTVLFSWGMMFTYVSQLSEKLYKKFLERDAIRPYDKRIFVFDVLAGIIIGFPMEMIGVKTGVWDYRQDLLHWSWGDIPFVKMPYEAFVGYGLLMLTAPTFIRYWQGAFEKGDHRG